MAPLAFIFYKITSVERKTVLILIDFILNQSAMGSIVQATKNKTCSDTLNSQGHQIFLFPTANNKIDTDVLCVALSKWSL